MPDTSLWITGKTLSGKTSRLIKEFCIRGQEIQSPLNKVVPVLKVEKLKSDRDNQIGNFQYTEPKILVLAANTKSRINLIDRISEATSEQYPY